MRRRWEEIHKSNAKTLPFEDWVQAVVESEDLDANNPEDFDKLLFCRKPSQRAIRYNRMKAFGNHFYVEEEATACMQTYDSGVAPIFKVPTADAKDLSVKLDYGPLSSPIVLLKC